MHIPRESIEYLPLNVELDDEAAEDYQVAVVAARARPVTFTGGPYLISGLPVTTAGYDAYVKVSDNPEFPVVYAGRFWIT